MRSLYISTDSPLRTNPPGARRPFVNAQAQMVAEQEADAERERDLKQRERDLKRGRERQGSVPELPEINGAEEGQALAQQTVADGARRLRSFLARYEDALRQRPFSGPFSGQPSLILTSFQLSPAPQRSRTRASEGWRWTWRRQSAPRPRSP